MTVTAFPNRREPRFYRSDRDPAGQYRPADLEDFRPATDARSDSEGAPPEPPAPSLLTSVGTAAAPAARRARTGAGAWLRRSGARVRQFVLSAGGLGAFAVGGFEAHPVAGWVITGLSLLLLEHQAKS